MSYQALARKWRPRTFSQLVGQEHINKALMNALDQQRLHHAYLFTGTRGVGKTSIARILAKSVNCEIGISSKPCLQCNTCNAIEQGRFMDLIEIDAASKTRVEDTRDLLDNVQYAPTSGRFKIYLIDEVHMLSHHSFNALLKTLEEPPEHVKFILATTDPQKLPVTILSRCLQFHLKHLATELISQHLQQILREEQFNFETQAVDILAQAARGSMRDALSLLDQAISGSDTKLCAYDVKMILGYTQQDYALKLLDALAMHNAMMIVTISQQIATECGNFQYVLDELLNYLHQIAIFQHTGNQNPLITPAIEIQSIAQKISPEDIQLFYQIGLKGREEIQLAPTLVIGFNMTMLRMLAFRPASTAAAPPLASYIDTAPLELQANPFKDHATSTVPKETVSGQNFEELSISPANLNNETQETKPLNQQETNDWATIITHLKLTGLALNAAENAELISMAGKEFQLRVAKGHQSLFTPTVLKRIENAMSQFYQTQMKLILIADEIIQDSPAQKKEQATQQKQQNAELSLHNDPVFQQLQQEFSAELVKNSIVPLKDDL